MISLSSTGAVLQAIDSARNVTFGGFVLRRGCAVEQALERAAERHAQVTVRLNGFFDRHNGAPPMLCENRRCVDRLRRLGADARLMNDAGGNESALHLKAAVCDNAAFLDDRNWSGDGDTIVRDDIPSHVGAVRAAVTLGRTGSCGIALRKTDALDLEAAVIASSRQSGADVATESISRKSNVRAALEQLAQAKRRPRLLISEEDLSGDYLLTARQLQKEGVRVRVGSKCEKYAVTGTQAWIGSANATCKTFPLHELDWGIRTHSKRLVDALQARFNDEWKHARPLPTVNSKNAN